MSTTILLLPALLNSSIGIFVILKNPQSSVHRIFGLISFCLAFWSFIIFIRSNLPANLFLYQLTFATPFILPVLFLHFSYIFPNKLNCSKLWQIIYLSVGCVFLFLWPLSVSYIDESGKRIDGLVTKFFLPYMFIFLGITVFNFLKKYHLLKKELKIQLSIFLFGFLFMLIISIFSNGILPVCGITDFYILGPLSTSFFVVFVAYAILRHRFFGIDIEIHKRIVTSIFLAVLACLFAGVITYSFLQDILIFYQFTITVISCVLYYIFAKAIVRWFDTSSFFEKLGASTSVLDEVEEQSIFSLLKDCDKKICTWFSKAGVDFLL